MTIIAALKESPDSILIAADSQQIERDDSGMIRSSTNHKLQVHPTMAMAWAISDNVTIGTHFNGWLKRYNTIANADWYTVQQEIATQLSLLNSHQRQLCRIAGKIPQDSELCRVLIVGFLDGVGTVFEIDAGGFLTIKEDEDFHTIGSGSNYADVAHRTLMRIKSNASSEDKLRTIVGIAAETAPSCGPPVHVARVTPHGAKLLNQ